MSDDDKVTGLIVKLNRLTVESRISWKIEDAPLTIFRGTDDYIPLFFATRYKGRRFGLYQQRFTGFDIEREKSYWNERVVLAILDYEDRVVWEAPSHSAIHDLFETVRAQVADIEGILDELLDGDDDDDLLDDDDLSDDDSDE